MGLDLVRHFFLPFHHILPFSPHFFPTVSSSFSRDEQPATLLLPAASHNAVLSFISINCHRHSPAHATSPNGAYNSASQIPLLPQQTSVPTNYAVDRRCLSFLYLNAPQGHVRTTARCELVPVRSFFSFLGSSFVVPYFHLVPGLPLFTRPPLLCHTHSMPTQFPHRHRISINPASKQPSFSNVLAVSNKSASHCRAPQIISLKSRMQFVFGPISRSAKEYRRQHLQRPY